MQTALFDYHLPDGSIAQQPLAERDAAKLLAIDRAAGSWRDSCVKDLADFFGSGDLVILNDTRVIPARLRATRDSSGGKIEFLLVPEADAPFGEDGTEGASIPNGAEKTTPAAGGGAASVIRRALIKAGGKLRAGEAFTLLGGPSGEIRSGSPIKAVLRERCGEAGDRVEFFATPAEFSRHIELHGEVPLPPYIRRPAGPSSDFDRERYQTVFARAPGAVAAPTAGLHFTPRVLAALQQNGVECRYLTLHVGPGTFRPVKAEQVEAHFVDAEPFIMPAETAQAVARAKAAGRRVIAVGTTSMRALEGAADLLLRPETASSPHDLRGRTDIFIYPPYQFRIVDGLLTNFHVPKSSLLMLVSAFAAPGKTAGIGLVKAAYAHAVESGYRFYSYGDACLLI